MVVVEDGAVAGADVVAGEAGAGDEVVVVDVRITTTIIIIIKINITLHPLHITILLGLILIGLDLGNSPTGPHLHALFPHSPLALSRASWGLPHVGLSKPTSLIPPLLNLGQL